jgi:hypothetical protein
MNDEHDIPRVTSPGDSTDDAKSDALLRFSEGSQS